MHNPALVVKNIGGKVREAVQLARPVRHIAQEHRHVIIGIRPRTATRTRSIQDDAFKTCAIHFIERMAEVGQGRILESGFGHDLFLSWRPCIGEPIYNNAL